MLNYHNDIESEMTTLVNICPAIVGSKEEVVLFLQAKGGGVLLRQQKRCSNCASVMNLQKRRNSRTSIGTLNIKYVYYKK